MFRIISRHVLDGLRLLPDNSFQTAVTSTPYFGTRNYPVDPIWWGGDPECDHDSTGQFVYVGVDGGKNSPKHQIKGSDNFQSVGDQLQGICRHCGAWLGQLGQEPSIAMFTEHLVRVFREVRRVLKPDGVLWLNLGDTFAGSGRGLMGDRSQAPRAGAKQSTNRGTTVQGIVKAQTGTIVRSKRIPRGDGRWGGGDKYVSELKRQDLMMIPATVAMALQDDGWWLRSEIFWYKPNGFCESVKNRPTRKTERLYVLSKGYPYYWDRDAAREPAAASTKKRINQTTFDTQTGGPKDYGKTEVNTNRSMRKALENLKGSFDGMRNIQDVWVVDDDDEDLPPSGLWVINTEPNRTNHFAAFPTELPRRCIAITSRPGDWVLDPFSGTGRAGKAALQLGRNYVGIELSGEFAEQSEEMLEALR